jgi:hypothetical protein
MAGQIQKAFKNAGINCPMTVGGIEDDNDIGIQVYIRSIETKSANDEKYITALMDSGVSFRLVEMPKTFDYSPYNLSIFVGPRETINH